MNKSEPLDPKLNKMIVESIHKDVIEAIDGSIEDAMERLKRELGLKME